MSAACFSYLRYCTASLSESNMGSSFPEYKLGRTVVGCGKESSRL